MNLKKKLRKFFTLSRRHEAGFTLVELIVVIAILAILAGAGTAGYAGYIKSSNKNNDKVLVGNVIRALETAAYSNYTNFVMDGQYSQGLQVPVGFVVLCDEELTYNGQTGYALAISNDATADPIGAALTASMGSDFRTTAALKYNGWSVSSITGSTLHNASASMVGKIDDVGALMIALDGIVESMTEGSYEDTGDMIIAVAKRIADFDDDGKIETEDRTKFVAVWAGATEKSTSSYGFDLNGRENYSAVRMAYSNAFAEYVRANYKGAKDVTTLANNIANYGQSAGDLAYEEAYDIAYDKAPIFKEEAGEAAGKIAKEAAEEAAPDAVFPYAATRKAFDDANYAGYGDQDVKDLYDEWIKGQDEKDAAMFYDTMLTCATDGAAYATENGTDQFVNWFKTQAQAYSNNFTAIQDLVKGKSAIVVVVYYQNGLLNCEVYDPSASPREE